MRGGLADKRRLYQRAAGLILSQPLLDYPELDPYTQHPASFPVVAQLMGGDENVRFSEFNFREAPEGAGHGAMNFHHDAVVADRVEREPYMPCDWLCAIHYLTDVMPGTPSFCVVPGSVSYSTHWKKHTSNWVAAIRRYPFTVLQAPVCSTTRLFTTHVWMAMESRHVVPGISIMHAAAGYRVPLPASDRYVRPPTPVLTNWNLFPERLALHADPKKRLFFSHWNTAQCEWVASGFSDEVRISMPRGNK